VISNRRLIATIRGRATAGASIDQVPLAARPGIVRPLTRTTLAVGLAGVTVAVALGGGGVLLRDAAEAAVAGGASYGGGRTEAAVTGLSGTDAAQAALDAPVSAALPASVPAVTARVTVDPPAPAPAAATPAAPAVAAVAAPTPPPAPPAPPPPGTVEAIIVEIFGATHGQAAIGVARCESGLNPAAVSRGGGNWGLFQINTAHRRRVANMGYQWEDLLDPRVNTLVAHSIFSEQGWRPWGCRHAAH
jgi:soluble lytic murein transglycosylase-like protein